MKKASRVWAMALLLVLLSAGCGKTEKLEEQQLAQAMEVVDGIYAAIRAGDFKGATAYYNEQFLGMVTAETRHSQLREMRDHLGVLQSHVVVSYEVEDSSDGIWVYLKLETTYTKHTADERMTVFQPIGGQFAVHSHETYSPGLAGMK